MTYEFSAEEPCPLCDAHMTDGLIVHETGCEAAAGDAPEKLTTLLHELEEDDEPITSENLRVQFGGRQFDLEEIAKRSGNPGMIEMLKKLLDKPKG